MHVSNVKLPFVSFSRKFQAECDNEGAGDEAEFKQDKNGNDLVIIRADHITKIAAELLMDFS